MNFELSNQERESALWKKLVKHVEARLDISRKKNDGSLLVDETNRLRGRIASYKEFLALGLDK